MGPVERAERVLKLVEAFESLETLSSQLLEIDANVVIPNFKLDEFEKSCLECGIPSLSNTDTSSRACMYVL